jgi:flagella basal body P-ring formation protein FlgA
VFASRRLILFSITALVWVSIVASISLPANLRVPVVKGGLLPQQLISSSNWEWKSLPDKNLSQFIIRDSTGLEGKLSRYIKNSGDLFYLGDLRVPDIIHNQDNVIITIRTANIRVSVPGIALKNGPLGCTIRVLNPATQKILDAVIIDSRNVEVRFN